MQARGPSQTTRMIKVGNSQGKAADRRNRLAEELRANLKRRKEKSREAKKKDEAAGADEGKGRCG